MGSLCSLPELPSENHDQVWRTHSGFIGENISQLEDPAEWEYIYQS